jgi:hypothetical protein
MKKKIRRQYKVHHKPLLQSFLYILFSLVLAVLIIFVPPFHSAIMALSGAGYIGAFIAGIFFVSVFTAAPAAVVLLLLSQTMPVVSVAIVAGFGAVIGDILILFTLKQGIDTTVPYFPKEFGLEKIIKILRHTKYRFLLTLLGGIIIASPLPDEIGLALMGLTGLSPFASAAMTFVLNSAGIYFLLQLLR